MQSAQGSLERAPTNDTIVLAKHQKTSVKSFARLRGEKGPCGLESSRCQRKSPQGVAWGWTLESRWDLDVCVFGCDGGGLRQLIRGNGDAMRQDTDAINARGMFWTQ